MINKNLFQYSAQISVTLIFVFLYLQYLSSAKPFEPVSESTVFYETLSKQLPAQMSVVISGSLSFECSTAKPLLTHENCLRLFELLQNQRELLRTNCSTPSRCMILRLQTPSENLEYNLQVDELRKNIHGQTFLKLLALYARGSGSSSVQG